MSGSSYTKKKIDLVIDIGKGAYGQDGTTQVALSGLRVSAEISKVGGQSMGSASIRVYGLPPSLINQVTTLGLQPERTRDNRVSVLAGDDVSGMTLVYQGTIYEAWADYTGMPDTYVLIEGLDGLLAAIKPVPPSSYPASADCATIMANLAAQMHLRFENNGVSVLLNNPYFPGTARQQAMACAKAGGFYWYADGDVLAIWPRGGGRGGAAPLISPETGMIGYPTFASAAGVAITTLYNPAVRFASRIQVRSSIIPACGTWFVRKLSHHLESETPGGQWFSMMEAIRTPIDPRGQSGG